MKFIAMAAVAALMAAPVAAQDNANFVGVRAEATVGLNDITSAPDADDVVYGAAVGVDFPVGDRVTLGVEANSSNVFDSDRQIGAAARLGYAFDRNTLGYVKGGYNNYRDVFSRELDGFVVGAGIEQAITRNSFVKVQYDYSDFDRGVGSHAVLAGLGVRF